MGGTPEPSDAPGRADPVAGPPAAGDGGDPLVGRVLDGRYRITGKIGAGGMGAVYRCEHVTIGKPMAVKVLHPRLGALAEAGERFRREAFVGGKIGHPNCVAVSDFGTLDDGAFYLVMELLEGESLGDVLERETRLPWPRALRIARHVLRGLGHAHERGVVHRDIKPDNVFLERTDDDPEVAKILDFGIAKLVGEAGGATITQAGITIGTPAYLSPEQAFGGELDGRSDLYSLSVVLFELLTGRTPFADRDMLAMLTAHAVADVPAIADVAPDAEVPPGVEALVRDGLAKQAADRIPSATEYVARIDALLGRAGTDARAWAAVTPTPMPVVTATLPVAAAATPAPGTLSAPSATAPAVAPRTWRRPALWGAGAVVGIGLVAALASRGGHGGGGTSAARGTASAPAAIPDAAPARPAAPPPDAAPAASAAPAPILPPAVPVAAAAADERLAAALDRLAKGKKCADRKAAVAELRALGDPRAIPALKKARFRMRGGLLGIGEKNHNACLKKDAEAAIEALSPPGAGGAAGGR